jgi:hypothetical protein
MPASRIDFKGPFFEAGRRSAVMRKLERDTQDEIDQYGVDLIVGLLAAVLKHPTGYYQSKIKAHRSTTHTIIDDSRVIYGHWLEGTGSRNYPVTRFKGYHTFRRAGQILPEKAHAIARRNVTRAVLELGGR